MKLILLAGLLAVSPAMALDTELTRFNDSCGDFKVLPCLTLLFTDHPFHIGVTSLAPGNGFAVGPALSFTHHVKPVHHKGPNGDTVTNWRLAWDTDAVVSDNKSWRTGVYLTARYTVEPPVIPVAGVGTSKGADLRPKTTVFTAYMESESLNKLNYYGIGQGTSRSAIAFYGMRQTIAGGTATMPLGTPLNLSLFGEANVRVVNLRSDTNDGGPSIEQIYTAATAPGLSFQTTGFGQFGEGLRMNPVIGDRLAFLYSVTLKEYASTAANSSFERLTVDLGHTFSLYGKSTPLPPVFNGPDSCAKFDSDLKDACPRPTMSENLEGSLSFRFLLNESFASPGSVVPFYFQPTLGGSDIDGNSSLPSYADYRFRGPNSILFHEQFEHSLGKFPAGFLFMADEGEVAATRGGLGFGNIAHSFGAGITLHAGGFPVLSVVFAFGGKEGTHTLAQVNSSLLGGGGRPSLY